MENDPLSDRIRNIEHMLDVVGLLVILGISAGVGMAAYYWLLADWGWSHIWRVLGAIAIASAGQRILATEFHRRRP